MSSPNKNIEIAEKYCAEKGERLTKKRKVVLLALFTLQKAISAYELVDYCQKQFNEIISAMSVYRILDFLKAQGLVHKLELANKYVACSHIICEHQHEVTQFLICTQCQHVEEISVDPLVLKRLQDPISQSGFHLSSPQLELNGVCDKCL